MTEKRSESSRCPACSAEFDLPADFPPSAWVRCAGCSGMVFPVRQGTPVLIGHASEDICQCAGVALVPAGFAPLCAADGDQAIAMLDTHQPGAAVLDVALGGVLAFEVIDYLRRTPHLADTKVVLIASVYSKTAYKCKPRSLYGADDYVEQHHIHDRLVDKLCRLLGQEQPMTRTFSELRQVQPRTGYPSGADAGLLRALARRIVADIALYHQAEVEAVVNTGQFEGMADLLEEGRGLYSDRGGEPMDGDPDPVLTAFRNLVTEMGRLR